MIQEPLIINPETYDHEATEHEAEKLARGMFYKTLTFNPEDEEYCEQVVVIELMRLTSIINLETAHRRLVSIHPIYSDCDYGDFNWSTDNAYESCDRYARRLGATTDWKLAGWEWLLDTPTKTCARCGKEIDVRSWHWALALNFLTKDADGSMSEEDTSYPAHFCTDCAPVKEEHLVAVPA